MKKLFLGILLIVLLGAVSYVKSVRDQEKEAASRQQGRSDALAEIKMLKASAESLRVTLGEYAVSYADTIVQQHLDFQLETDSLKRELETREKRISELQQLLASAPAEKKVTTPVKKKDPVLEKQKQILSYYKNRYQKLPGDLSEYERKVALTEIREETAKKFSISLGDLKKIRSNGGFTY